MESQPGFFDIENRYESLSKFGDPLEKLKKIVDFEIFREEIDKSLKFAERLKGGRPPYDSVLMFKVLVLQALYNVSDDQIEYQIKDRLSFMRFLDLDITQRVPDAKTVWLYRERLSKNSLIEKLFQAFDHALKEQGYLAMSGQIVDATIVSAPRQRMTKEELLSKHGFRSQLHRKKPKGKPMPANISRANGKKSTVRCHVEHVFAVQKTQMKLFIRTIGLTRATCKITLVNLVYNMKRLVFWKTRRAFAG